MRRGVVAAACLSSACLLPLPFVVADDDTHVVVAFAAEPTQIDPTRTSAGVDQYFMALFYEQLLTAGPDLRQRNWLAESWRLFERDGVWLIGVELRRGVRFHNGDELTAHDLRYCYLRQRDPSLSRQAGRWRHVDDVRVLGDHELEIVFEGLPDSALLPLNLDLWAIPRRYYEEVGNEGVQAHPIGTGPWKFVSRSVREEIVVERFDDYWDPDSLPGIRRLTIKIIPEDTTRVAAFKTGAVDWIDAVPPAQVADFERTPGVKVASLPTSNNLFLALNAL
ncbi:MAG: ABC transporter substrate-binding protein, partial [Holophagales bacterium]|nr:ABC transporter substrate-binding protein [Holophagales bacterium]